MKIKTINISSTKQLYSNVDDLESLRFLDCSGSLATINTHAVYEDTNSNLGTQYNTNIVSEILYVPFADKRLRPSSNDNIENILTSYKISDGRGITRANLSNISRSNLFSYGTTVWATIFSYSNITSFNEFELCTGLPVEIGKGDEALCFFKNCKELTSIKFPELITSISRICEGCEKLTSVLLPSGLKRIWRLCFANCTSLDNINLPDSITEMLDAFYNCTSLKSIKLPESLVSLDSTFANCTNLESVQFGSNLKTIGHAAFYKTGIKECIIPDSVESMSSEIFRNCELLHTLIMPPNLTLFDGYNIMGTPELHEITFNNLHPIRFKSNCFYIENQTKDVVNKVTIKNLDNWCKSTFETIWGNPCVGSHCLYVNDDKIESLDLPHLGISQVNTYALSYLHDISKLVLNSQIVALENAFYKSAIKEVEGENIESIRYFTRQYLDNTSSVERINASYNELITVPGFTTALCLNLRGKKFDGEEINHTCNIENLHCDVIDETIHLSDLTYLNASEPQDVGNGYKKVHINNYGGIDITYNQSLYYVDITDGLADYILANQFGDKIGITQALCDAITDFNWNFAEKRVKTLSWVSNFPNLTNLYRVGNTSALVNADGIVLSNITRLEGFLSGSSVVEYNGAGLDTSKITDGFQWIGRPCNTLKKADFSTWNTRNVTDMTGFLYNCYSLEEVNLEGMSTWSSTGFAYIFGSASQTLKSIKLTSSWFDAAIRPNNPYLTFLMLYSRVWVNLEELTNLINCLPDLTNLNRTATLRIHSNSLNVVRDNNLIPIAAAKGWTVTE